MRHLVELQRPGPELNEGPEGGGRWPFLPAMWDHGAMAAEELIRELDALDDAEEPGA
jgi:hypothetical protein